MTALAPESFREQLLNRRYEPNVAAVNELCDSLQSVKPHTEVPYVDPMHDVDECRIISLYSNIGTADESGFITAGDTVPITVIRGTEKKTFEVQADFHPQSHHTPLLAAPGQNGLPLQIESTRRTP